MKIYTEMMLKLKRFFILILFVCLIGCGKTNKKEIVNLQNATAKKIYIQTSTEQTSVTPEAKKQLQIKISKQFNITPLMQAIDEERYDDAKLLIEQGADVNIKDDFGETALTSAARKDNVELIKILLDKGANINAKIDICAADALFLAVANGNTEIVRVLLEHGGNINSTDDTGKTTVMEASERGNVEIIKDLIQSGANLNSVDKSGNTAIYFASVKNRSEIVKLLALGGADIDATPTPLMVFAQNGDVEMVKFLLDHGADINKTGKDGETALGLARVSKRNNVIQLLIDRGAKN